jgi:hypothetical protein
MQILRYQHSDGVHYVACLKALENVDTYVTDPKEIETIDARQKEMGLEVIPVDWTNTQSIEETRANKDLIWF